MQAYWNLDLLHFVKLEIFRFLNIDPGIESVLFLPDKILKPLGAHPNL